METYVKEKRYGQRIFSSGPASAPQTDVESALMSIAAVRFDAFRDHFGREPLQDEPLFFDPEADSPVEANPSQAHAQLLDACRAMGVAPSMLENFWNLAQADAV
ncbi:MAG TPA: hypothetical protein VNE82_17075 [Candidatus Binataceae bacterium]|nr:hypothetical protein [Candidatus Binataceae bacterium]